MESAGHLTVQDEADVCEKSRVEEHERENLDGVPYERINNDSLLTSGVQILPVN